MSHLLKYGNVGQNIINNTIAPSTVDHVCANYPWF